jgi:hypothetical protein
MSNAVVESRFLKIIIPRGIVNLFSSADRSFPGQTARRKDKHTRYLPRSLQVPRQMMEYAPLSNFARRKVDEVLKITFYNLIGSPSGVPGSLFYDLNVASLSKVPKKFHAPFRSKRHRFYFIFNASVKWRFLIFSSRPHIPTTIIRRCIPLFSS